MATPSDLVKAVSMSTGVPTATVVDLDRRLVKAGLRSVGGRGPSAAKVTPLDAARLITAVLASPQANAAPEAVQNYQETRPDKSRSSPKLFAHRALGDLANLPARHSFVEGLAAIIQSAATGALAAFEGKTQKPQIEIYAFTHAVHGRIRLSGLPARQVVNVEYVPTSPAKTAKPTGDLEQSRRITDRTIFAVAKLFA